MLDIVTDRSIRITLKRRARDEVVERFRLRDACRVGAPLRGKLEAWQGAAVEALRDAEPVLPAELVRRPVTLEDRWASDHPSARGPVA